MLKRRLTHNPSQDGFRCAAGGQIYNRTLTCVQMGEAQKTLLEQRGAWERGGGMIRVEHRVGGGGGDKSSYRQCRPRGTWKKKITRKSLIFLPWGMSASPSLGLFNKSQIAHRGFSVKVLLFENIFRG